jgi:hypothetical protein
VVYAASVSLACEGAAELYQATQDCLCVRCGALCRSCGGTGEVAVCLECLADVDDSGECREVFLACYADER